MSFDRNLFNLDSTKTYVVAVSFGVDSMVLLDLCRQAKVSIVIAHVNYHRRDVSNLEQSQLEQYALQHDIPIYVLDVQDQPVGNFQAWARQVRYVFFAQLIQEGLGDAVLIAHHRDDHLETGLFQERRGGFIRHWGLEEDTTLEGVQVIRPLLSWSKKDIRHYQATHGIPYSEDASNASMDYTRNRLRKEIQTWTPVQRQSYINKMETYNQGQRVLKDKLEPHLVSYKRLINMYSSWSTHEQIFFWVLWFESRHIHYPVTASFLSRIQGWIQSKKPNLALPLVEGWTLYKAYDHFALLNEKDLQPYVYQHRQPKVMDHPFFSWKGEDYRLSPYPILLRSVEKEDYQRIKKLNRMFIEWKVPMYLRRCYPILIRPGTPFLHVPVYEKTTQEKRSDGLYFT